MTAMAAVSSYHSQYLHSQSPTYLPGFQRYQERHVTVRPMEEQRPTSLPRLAQSRSRADFFRHLGWNERDENHKRLYNLMKDEASQSRADLSADRSNLNHEALNDPRVQPPFSSSQMTETALWREVHNIWQRASPETRPIYDLGSYTESGNPDNWIIRWVLWHVFRYRDVRNRNRSNPVGRSERASSTSSAGSPVSAAVTPGSSRMVFDPVRDAHNAHNASGAGR